MKSKLAALIEVRKLITLSVTVLFIYLAVFQFIDSKFVEYMISMVIGYYFGKSTALDKSGELK